jgi:uncharacterized protein YbbK (DUF523 family)
MSKSRQGGNLVTVAVSSCLIGKKCRYDGSHSLDLQLVKKLAESDQDYIDFCPEVIAGLPVPREPLEIVSSNNSSDGAGVLDGHARVHTSAGIDYTDDLVFGAVEALYLCSTAGVTKAYLKSRSPSCGRGSIHDGSFSGQLKAGSGVTAELLARNGIEVIAK